MTIENEIRLRFETFVYHKSNQDNEDLKRCKNANKYFFDNQTGIKVTSEMILKMQKPMMNILPKNEDQHTQFFRLNEIVKMCKDNLKMIENVKG